MKNISSILLAIATATSSLTAQNKQTTIDSSVTSQDSLSATTDTTASQMPQSVFVRPLWEPQNNYLSISFGGGINTLKYDLEVGERSPMAGGSFNIDYNLFFSQKWGISFGGGFTIYNAKSTINTQYETSEKIPVTYYDGTTELTESTLYTTFNGWEERQTCFALETPIGVLYRRYLGGNTTLLMGTGIKFEYPVKTSYRVKAGTRTISGYLESADMEINSDLPQHGYKKHYDRPNGTTETKHFNAGIYLDMNFVHKTANADFFYGIYGTLGLSGLRKTTVIYTSIPQSDNKSLANINNYCGVLESTAASDPKLNAIGIRLGVKIPCPRLKDNDGDGVLDKFDKCLGTPAGVPVDSCGCPFDTDKDSVPDYLDKCPNTPKGIAVDSVGCPLDSDGDGVPDYLDKCPDTPDTLKVDENGCPMDSDGDGVADYLDKCPDTPKGRKVDSKGCPFDSDGDGVNDINDKCPDTPEGVEVDAKGCPIDSDGDGVPDYLDQCPMIKGSIKNNGCPKVSDKDKAALKQAVHGIQFETNKSVIKKVSYPVLDKVASVMKNNPLYKLHISGHTDNVGNPEKNMKLSKERAASVAKYLKMKGIKASRLRSSGYGDTKPVASNKTEKGKIANRRVEFEIEF